MEVPLWTISANTSGLLGTSQVPAEYLEMLFLLHLLTSQVDWHVS